MLATLFNNISIPAMARALIAGVISLLFVYIFYPFLDVNLHINLINFQSPPLFYKIILGLLILGMSWWFNTYTNLLGFLKSDYILTVVFLLVATPIILRSENVEMLLTLPLGILLMMRLLTLAKSTNPSYILFDAGVLTALMTLLLPETAIFLLISWIAALSFGHFNVRTFLMPLLGVLGLYFLLFAVLYWAVDFNGPEYLSQRFADLAPVFQFKNIHNIWIYIPLAIAVIPALLETVQVYGKANGQKRQIFTFLTLMFVLFLIAGVFIRESHNLWVWLAIPISVFVVNLIHYRKKNWQKDLYILFLLLFFVLGIFT